MASDLWYVISVEDANKFFHFEKVSIFHEATMSMVLCGTEKECDDYIKEYVKKLEAFRKRNKNAK